MAATIFYDGECPFCNKYTALLRLRDAVGPVELVDVRRHPNIALNLQRAGFDLDKGMVLETDGKRYHGADAMNRIALLSNERGPFNWINARFFGKPWLARALYPVLRAGRGATLFALGHERIGKNPAAELSAFAVFAHAFGMYAFADSLYQFFAGYSVPQTWAFGALGLYLLVRPRSPRIFCLLSALMLAQEIAKAPVQSNHALLVTFALLAIAVAGVYVWLRGRSWLAFMEAFSPVGRLLLLTMYFFGVFHKINTGFLNPDVSCAVDLWKAMPSPLSSLDGLWWRQSMIYGTLLGEAIMLVGLLFHRTRYVAVMLGIAFHSMLALSGYGFYLAFSTLTIALHLLFLSPGAATRITTARTWRLLQSRLHTRGGLIGIAAWAAGLIALTDLGQFTSVALLWLPWSVWLICLVGRHGRERRGESTVGPAIWSRSMALNLISASFVLNGFLPFLGLKNAQAMAMFANLTYQEGRSNHLLWPGPQWFGYMRDVVEPVGATKQIILQVGNERFMPYYALLDFLERNEAQQVSFIRGATLYENQNTVTLADDIHANLHPRWVRKWFHFRSFNSSESEACERGH
ncbi:MAG: DUF393 domain-containing protein [Variovorax sp.]|nr:MAG: DUF393 domain-containing protein [Variovorax sp.]